MIAAISFDHAPALWVLVAVPLVWWLLRVRVRRIATDRVDLWKRAAARVKSSRPRARWQRFVIALGVLALALAFAGPKLEGKLGLRHCITVIDASMSMLTRDVDGASGSVDRFAAAVTDMRRAVLPESVTRSAFVLVGSAIRPLEHAFGADRILAAASSEVADVRLVAAFVAQQPNDVFVVFRGDGAGPIGWPRPAPHLAMFSYGANTTQNGGIAIERVSDPWPLPELELRVSIYGKERQLEATYARDDTTVRLAVGEDGVVVLPRRAGGEVRLRLRPVDALARDDVADLVVRAPWAPALYVARDAGDRGADRTDGAGEAAATLTRFFTEALGGATELPRDAFARAAAARGGLSIVDGGRLGEWPEDGVVRILFGTDLPGAREARPYVGLPEWDPGDGLLTGLDPSEFRHATVSRWPVEGPADQVVLATLGGEPFVVRSTRHRLLWFAVPLTRDLVRRPSLPLLVLRALPALVGDTSALGGAATRLVTPRLDDAERDVAARPVDTAREAPPWWEPDVPLWLPLLGFAAFCFLLLACLP
ncbi:MAG: hypothetical protein H6832_18150 [Planctomycetes bacterium]|nr:hypothetical protein [Planctomycetota bacterium]MCB9892099.1 hypothetical protein [Planctomycetota bacterium]MCB9920329.1 hypothetical protein [Planctomycetota bacterium]